jgi:hypothetical protein
VTLNAPPLPRSTVTLVTGDVLLMLGHGEISKLIAWCSDSLYSHAAIVADDGNLIEAAPKGVRRKSFAERLEDRDNYHFVDGYRPLTRAGQPLTEGDRKSVLGKADALIGTGYPLDQLAVIGLLTAIRGKVPEGLMARFIVYMAIDHLLADDDSKLMCSELVYRCLAECDVSPRGKLAPTIVTGEATHWPFPDIDWVAFLRELAQVIIPPRRYKRYFEESLTAAADLDSRVPRYPGRQIEAAIEEARRRLAIPPPPDRNGVPVPDPNPKLITPLELTSTPSHTCLGRLMSG